MTNQESSESSIFESEIEVTGWQIVADVGIFSGRNRTSQQIARKQGSSTGSSKVRSRPAKHFRQFQVAAGRIAEYHDPNRGMILEES
jgi:hypothetical protein